MMADKPGTGGSSIGLIPRNIHEAEGGLLSLFEVGDVCQVGAHDDGGGDLGGCKT
jgi:hypothetical protein